MQHIISISSVEMCRPLSIPSQARRVRGAPVSDNSNDFFPATLSILARSAKFLWKNTNGELLADAFVFGAYPTVCAAHLMHGRLIGGGLLTFWSALSYAFFSQRRAKTNGAWYLSLAVSTNLFALWVLWQLDKDAAESEFWSGFGSQVDNAIMAFLPKLIGGILSVQGKK